MNLKYMSPYPQLILSLFSLPLYLSQNFKERLQALRPAAAYPGLEPEAHPCLRTMHKLYIKKEDKRAELK